MGVKSHFLKSFISCFFPRMARKSAMKFLMNIGAVLGLPRCIPSGSIAAKKVALLPTHTVPKTSECRVSIPIAIVKRG